MTTQAEAPSPFSIPIYRNVWLASLASNFGGLIQAVGASWTMTALGASTTMVALVQAATSLPIMLLSLWAGAVADNFPRRTVMLAAQAYMLAVSVLLSAAAFAGMLTPWLLLAATFLIACGTAVNGPAWQASVGDMVPRPALPSAVALNSMGFNVARSLGPAIGGVVVGLGGATAAFVMNAASYVGLIGILARWDAPSRADTLPRERLGLAMGAGVRFVALSPSILAILGRTFAFGLGASAVPALLPLVARHTLAGGATTYGLLLGGFGLGAVGGALASRQLRGRRSSEQLVRIACLAMAAGAFAVGRSTTLALALPALAVAGAGWVLALSTFNVGVQLLSPRWVVARTLALYQMAAFGGIALGSVAFGVLAERLGAADALMCSSACLVAAAALGLVLPTPPLTSPDLDVRSGWTAPDTALPIAWRSGPIAISIAYRIGDSEVDGFLSLMADRRRIRRRDGARRWSLLRDLGDPGLWLERYHFPTWLDYVRHGVRRLPGDLANSDALRALTGGSDGVEIHRLIERQVTGAAHPTVQEISEPLTDPTRAT